MNPDPAARGKELGEENADGENCIGTGGHGKSSSGVGMQFNTFELIVSKLISIYFLQVVINPLVDTMCQIYLNSLKNNYIQV